MTTKKTTFFYNKIEPLTFCGNNIGYEFTGSSYDLPYETLPTTGNKHDYTKCNGCQKVRKQIIDNIQKYLNEFPFCCETHTKLIKEKWFNKSDFNSVPEMVADKTIFTKQHYMNHLESENWYNEITDYIEYTVDSFGGFPLGYGNVFCLSYYFGFLKQLIEKIKVTGDEINKKKIIIDYINSYYKPKEKQTTDFNIVLQTYEKWYKIFPFELSFFQHLKPTFQKIPIVNGKVHHNKYLNRNSVKMHTKETLINTLLDLTNKLLTEINTEQLFSSGKLTDVNKIKIELVIQSRKLKLKQGYKNNANSEDQQYRNMLKEWFKDEKKFIDEIKPLLSEMPPQNVEQTTESDIQTENDFLVSTIEDYLANYKDKMNKTDYLNLQNAYKEYFLKGNFPKDCKEIKIIGKVNIKKLGWALNQLYRSEKNGNLPIEYLQFAKDKISIFKTISFSKEDYTKTTLYKYFTTKTQ